MRYFCQLEGGSLRMFMDRATADAYSQAKYQKHSSGGDSGGTCSDVGASSLGCMFYNEGQLLEVREVKPMGGALSVRVTVRYRRLARDEGNVGVVGPQLVRVLLTAPTPTEHNRWLEVLRMDMQLGGARRKSILKAAW